MFVVKLPDVGEGVAEAELLSWNVSVGDEVTPETVLAEVLTDKATVEITCPVTGRVAFLRGEPGDILAIGSEFVGIDAEGGAEPFAGAPSTVAGSGSGRGPTKRLTPSPATGAGPIVGRALAAPAVRQRARQLGVDLTAVAGSGPDGRVIHADLDALGRRPQPAPVRLPSGSGEPIRGLRRTISERLTASWTQVPHITYVEAVDATELERLRAELNGRDGAPKLTLLPFIATAIAIACAEHPQVNAHFDGTNLIRHERVDLGIATQTSDGLAVPVVRDVSGLGLDQLAAEIARVTEAARTRTAARHELSGSTMTVTSLGALGGLVTTPIINQPEVAIVGVNKLETRPVWAHAGFEPRQMFNLSSSFDHRVIDGWDAAVFIQRIKTLLEVPALLVVER